MSEMGPMRVRFRRCCRITSCPAAKGMSASMAVLRQIDAPSGTKRAMASLMDISLDAGTGPSYTGVRELVGPRPESVLVRVCHWEAESCHCAHQGTPPISRTWRTASLAARWHRSCTSSSEASMKTLRFHLFRLILLSLVPVLAFAAIVIGILHHQMDKLAEMGLADTAQTLSLVVDREVERLTSTLKALGASEHLRTGDLKAFDRFARNVLAQKPGLENIVLYDQSGRQLINLRVPFGATLPADDARRGQAVSSGGGRAVSNFFHGGLSGRALVQVDISVSGPDDGSPYLLGGSISPKALSEVLLAGRHLPDGTVGTLLDRNGIIIARTSRQEDFVGRAGDAGLDRKSTRLNSSHVAIS